MNEYHYTLYYYDQAGNLVATIPPSGVEPLNAAGITAVENYRDGVAGSAYTRPNHTLPTEYNYNSLGQVVADVSPDKGESKFWYDESGRLIFSVDAEQEEYFLANNHRKGSYTLYDELGRIREVGECINNSIVGDWLPTQNNVLLNYAQFENDLEESDCFDVTQTKYHTPLSAAVSNFFGTSGQENLRNRVASTTYEHVGDGDIETYNFATHYSYDIHGNVKALIQEFKELEVFDQSLKRMDYEYDLVSGNVNKVLYQDGQLDAFYHKYTYDADNRLLAVLTSIDDLHYERDAEYFYYDHGPLARMELGEYKVQGTDYAYTLQGWLKGVNSNSLDASRDIGKDGEDVASNNHVNVPEDVMGFTLGYFDGDYQAIGDTGDPLKRFEAIAPSIAIGDAGNSLYNGNISNMVTAQRDVDGSTMDIIPSVFKYDQLNRITEAQRKNALDATTNSWTHVDRNDYHSAYSYDGNGNLQTLDRNGSLGEVVGDELMDQLSYEYKPGTNQLLRVTDAITDDPFDLDISNQPDPNNYVYDAIGNLIEDKAEDISEILWNTYGKIKEVNRGTPTNERPDLAFAYDAAGNRILKLAKPSADPATWKSTWYVRDAQGNVMAIYDDEFELDEETTNPTRYFTLREQHLYGSSRLGMRATSFVEALSARKYTVEGTNLIAPSGEPILYTDDDPQKTDHYLGLKKYELSNHLGNVNSVVTDNRLAVDDGAGNIDEYKAQLVNTSDYYPFGMLMPGRFDSYNPGSIEQLTLLAEYNFDNGSIDGWNAASNATITNVQDQLQMVTTKSAAFIYKQENTYEPGETYRFSFDLISKDPTTVNLRFRIRDQVNAEIIFEADIPAGITNGHFEYEMVAPVNKMRIQFNRGEAPTNFTATYVLDNIKIEKVEQTQGSVLANAMNYRYGFNGKEMDNEVSGAGNQYDYGFRIYNPRIAKFLSVDPLASSYPWYTPYQFAGNKPINNIDLDGLEEYNYLWLQSRNGKTVLAYLGENDIVELKFDLRIENGSIKIFRKAVNEKKIYKVHTMTERLYHDILWNEKEVYEEFEFQDFNSLEEAKNVKESDFDLTEGDVWELWDFYSTNEDLMLNGKKGKKDKKRNKTQSHHLQPTQVKNHPFILKARKGGFQFEGQTNRTPLEQFLRSNGQGVHANHPNYNKQVIDHLNNVASTKKLNKKQSKDYLDKMNDYMLKRISENPGVKLNDIDLNLGQFKYNVD